MPKRGQITVFIIIGVIILIVAVSLFFLVSTVSSSKEILRPLSTDAISLFVERCLSQTTADGLEIIGKQGGYYQVPAPFKHYPIFTMPYYFHEGNSFIPTEERVKAELEAYIENEIKSCLDLKYFEQQGYQFSFSNSLKSDLIQDQFLTIPSQPIEVKVIFSPAKVQAELHYPFTVGLGLQQKELSSFKTAVDIPFKEIFKTIEGIAQMQQKQLDVLVLGDLLEAASQKNFYLSITTVGEGEVLFNLFFPIKHNELYNYAFLARYPKLDLDKAKIFSPQAELQSEALIYEHHSLEIPLPVLASGPDNFEFIPPADLWQDPNYLSNLNSQDFLASLFSNPSLFSNSAVLYEFENRLGEANFIEQLNQQRNLLNRWADLKGISFGNQGELLSYTNGLITTKGKQSTTFNPVDLPGATVLRSGEVQLPSKAVISSANIEKSSGALVINGGSIDLSNAINLENTRVVNAVVFRNSQEIYSQGGEPFFIEANAAGQPTIKGAEVFIAKDGQTELLLTGSLTLLDETSYTLYPDTLLREYRNEQPSLDYAIGRTIHFSMEGGGCAAIKNCIERDPDKSELKVSTDDGQVKIANLGNSLQKLIVDGKGQVEYFENNVQLLFSGKPVTVAGDPSTLRTEVEHIYTRDGKKSIKLLPAAHGIEIQFCLKLCTYQGMLTNEALLAMKNFADTKLRQDQLAQQFGAQYGERNSLRVLGYLDEPTELRIINAIQQAAEKTGLDPNFVAGAFFVEGLHGWISNEYYNNPDAELSAMGSLGADRFGKEEAILRDKGYLRPDFQEGADFSKEELLTSERGEASPRVIFKDVERGVEGAAAMLAYRRDLLKRDLRDNGLNPDDLTRDQLNYWTYVYYNAGSGPPEDPYGKGRAIIKERAKHGAGSLVIPSQKIVNKIVERKVSTEISSELIEIFNPLGNAQRVMATTKLIEEANPVPPEQAKKEIQAKRTQLADTGPGNEFKSN